MKCVVRKSKDRKKKQALGKGKFLSENIKDLYELEVKREGSIIEQTGKMLVFQSLYTAALYAALPSVLNYFSGKTDIANLIWVFVVIVTILVIVGLGITLTAQGRYKYKSLPKFEEVKQSIDKLSDQYTYEQIQCFYNIEYVTNMYKSLEKNDNMRCRMLKLSMLLFYITLLVTLIMIVVLVAL